ncbi:hypothetical protein RHSIM_Rhsim12G0024800 [Rhododendron simsii]|uniref:Uncharacterized protein n=1 Tax=Rhododendron simsii TaxID=118357 RepID=A0A834G1R8_RHOSS|nr:hypothetical protein RHSIM_Rhsim12G0024800 [Rhododendron simsii]
MQRCIFPNLLHKPPTILPAQRPFPRGGALPSIQPARTSSSSLSAARNSPSEAELTAVHSVPPINFLKRLPAPELGLLSLVFALSVSIAAIISVALISIPTAVALRRSAVAVEKLVGVASEELPGTLYSLRLSGMEIGDLTRELRKLRNWVSGNRDVKNSRGK